MESDDGFLMCETGWDDEWFGGGGWLSVLLRINRSCHDYVLPGPALIVARLHEIESVVIDN